MDNDNEPRNIYVKLYTKENTKDSDNETPKIYLQVDFENIKIKESIKNIKNQIPKLFDEETSDEENLNYLIKKVFREGYPNTLYFTNATFFNGEKDTIRLYFRPQKGRFLQDRMPDDLTLSFRGYVKEGFFVINEIRIIGEYDGEKDGEYKIKVNPIHTPEKIPKWRGKYLRELIDNSESVRKFLNGKLKDWMDYLSWRKELVKIRLVGIKYLKCYYRYDDKNDLHEIVFLLVAPSKEEFDDFRKYLKRENIKIFDNDYSIYKYKFRYNEQNRNLKKAEDLGKFVEIIEEIKPTDEQMEEYKNSGKSNSRKNKKDKNDDKNDIESLSENSYFVEIAFEIGEDYYDKIREKKLDNDEEKKKEFIKEEVKK